MSRIMLAGLAVFSMGLALSAGPASADDTKKEAGFKKYVGIYTRMQPKAQLILQNPQLRQLAGRTFVLGTPVEAVANMGDYELRPFKNAVRWVAWEEVIEFYEFDNARGLMPDPAK